MNCCDCVFFRAGILTDFCAWACNFLFDYTPCPAFRDSISCYKVSNDVNGEGDAV